MAEEGLLAKIRAAVRARNPSVRALPALDAAALVQPEHLDFARGIPVPEEAVSLLVSEVQHYTPVPVSDLPPKLVPGSPQFYAAMDGETASYLHTRQVREEVKARNNS